MLKSEYCMKKLHFSVGVQLVKASFEGNEYKNTGKIHSIKDWNSEHLSGFEYI